MKHRWEDLSPRERILRGLQAMARALNSTNSWTEEARDGYKAASKTAYELKGQNEKDSSTS